VSSGIEGRREKLDETFEEGSKPCHLLFFSFSFTGEVESWTAPSLASCINKEEGRLPRTPPSSSVLDPEADALATVAKMLKS
jgi:hypothetical protein